MTVHPAEVKLATSLQVVLDAGWSVQEENWQDFLEVSGIADIRRKYWEAYAT